MLQSTVDRRGRPVGGAGPVEEGEHVDRALFQGAAYASDLDQRGRDADREGVDHGLHPLLAPGLVRFPVGGDDALIDAPGRLDIEVFLAGEHSLQPGVPTLDEETGAGVQGAADPIEQITGATAMPERVLLDTLRTQIEDPVRRDGRTW